MRVEKKEEKGTIEIKENVAVKLKGQTVLLEKGDKIRVLEGTHTQEFLAIEMGKIAIAVSELIPLGLSNVEAWLFVQECKRFDVYIAEKDLVDLYAVLWKSVGKFTYPSNYQKIIRDWLYERFLYNEETKVLHKEYIPRYGYSKDPRVIRARYDSVCAETGNVIKKGDECVYYPSSGSCYSMDSKQAKEYFEWKDDLAMMGEFY